MKFTKLSLPELIVIEPKVHGDPRGAFWQRYRKEMCIANGIKEELVQGDQRIWPKGVLRGLHRQVVPMLQSQLGRVVLGEVYDVAVDSRPASPTFGRWAGEVLSAENKRVRYVPKGFAHGFLTLSD